MTRKITVGLLGLGSRSTTFYLHTLNAYYQKIKKGYSTFPCVLYNINFNTINPYLPDNTAELITNLKPVMNSLERFSIDYLVVPNITLHETLEVMKVTGSLIHPRTLAIEKLQDYGQSTITLIGSHYTMNANYLVKGFEKAGIKVETPTPKDQKSIDTLRKKVYDSEETEADVLAFRTLLEVYKAQSTVMICCTELSVINVEPNGKRCIDMAILQIEKTISLKT
ncbi:hypothetical protein N7U66_01000 [Lacinutrix neustonica]|uniref:Aspartate racemase n=1 Tax=Lacinutrix neustonica TaxID=2980107 RepID=A0A9E8MVI8_9FLAO|nr:hypothetical protein [Lacinutrix neustonica]WAC02353.1 hypothetical protein N7U66_01000 [Lacinutrix neustonica]